MRDGGGTRRPLDSPARTASSQPSASASGKSSPSAGRPQRARPLLRCFSSVTGSTATLICTRDIITPAKGKVPHMNAVIPGRPPRNDRGLVGHHHVLLVDQVVEHFLHVDIGLDDAGLLQGDA